MTDDVIARLRPSGGRRIFATMTLGMLGLLLMWFAVTTPADALWRAVLFLFGAAAGYFCWRLWTATEQWIELTAEGLREASGALIVGLDQIEGVERGTFAFKPSNGFLLRLKTAQPRAWAPGLWWRMGKSVGIGGVTSGHEGKFMAEAIQTLLAQRS